MLIPYMRWENELYFLCMRPSNATFGGDAYQFCKGRIEDGETSAIAAMREATEELGIIPYYGSEPVFVKRIMNDTCDLFICEYNFNSYPKTKEETIHTAFLSEREFMLIGRDWQRPIAHIVAKFINEQATT
jgi:8-oxo-dGTP pyrophosphatase MutT (NUDIX family)